MKGNSSVSVPQSVDLMDRPIHVGDLLRTFHFRDQRRRTHWLFHVVCWNASESCLEAVPYSELCGPSNGGRFWIRPGETIQSEIVAGPMIDGRLFNERKKRKATP